MTPRSCARFAGIPWLVARVFSFISEVWGPSGWFITIASIICVVLGMTCQRGARCLRH